MNPFKKMVKSVSFFMAIVLLLGSVSYQSATAAMIGTEELLQAANPQAKRDYLHRLMAREDVQSALIARGTDPLETQLRIQCLTDDEVLLISENIDDLMAGSGVEIFSLIVIAAIIATVLIFKLTNITDVFP